MSKWLIIFIYIFFAYGISNIFVFGSGPFKIFEHIRNLANRISAHTGLLFSCMMCFPANVGLVFSLVDWFFIPIEIAPFNMILSSYPNLWWFAAICDCCFTSGVVWLIHHVEEWFENMAEGTTPNSPLYGEEYEDTIEVDDITKKNNEK